MPLSETTLLKVAGDLVYARGEDYVRYVRGLRTTDFKAYASIQAKNVYTVELDWSGPLPDGSCTCRHHADGNFCKHLVATGLAAIDTGRVAVDDTASSTAEAALEAAVQAMDVDELRELVMTLAQRDDGVRRLLEIRATTASGDDAHAKAELEAYVRNTLAFRGFVDYRRSFEVAEVASEMLDELENHLNSGAAEIVRPALLRAVTRLRKIIEQVDDSSGSIGDQCQRAADLYARACRLGEPDPVKLATWLVKFRADSPGWPHLVLADFVDSFDEQALGTYRRAVAALDRKLEDRDQWGRFEVDAMLLELADHDGDVDRAVHLLSSAGTPAVRGDRRPVAGSRPHRGCGGMDRSCSCRWTNQQPRWWQRILAEPGRRRRRRTRDWAGSTMRSPSFAQTSSGSRRCGAYRVLLDFAAGVDRVDTERTWAFDHARATGGL